MIKSFRIYDRKTGELLLLFKCNKKGKYDFSCRSDIYDGIEVEARDEDNQKIYFVGSKK